MGVYGDDIFGLPIGSSQPLFLAILAIHIAAGIVAVLSGAVAALSPKGRTWHRSAGKVYLWAIGAVFLSATALAIMEWERDFHLFFIGIVALVGAAVGYLHRRLRRPGDVVHIIGMGVSYAAMLTAFYVDNGPHLPLWNLLPDWVFWVLPAAVALPIVAASAWKHRRRRPR